MDGPDPADTELDGFESDLDSVASALDALDAEDLETAEALVAGLADDPGVAGATTSDEG